jgi:phosphoserine aminotransferase
MQIYNFNPGPALLPKDILVQAQKELLNYQGVGYSILEMSHRSPIFEALLEAMKADVRELLKVPNNYHILFMHGGARQQFSAAPMNLLSENKQADYVITGAWSKMAYEEAQRYGDIHVAALPDKEDFTYTPNPKTWNLRKDAAYVHYTTNETIHGVQFHFTPNIKIPLVADMSSDLFTRPIDVKRYGLIYAAAQKNFGPAGLTLVIIREDLVKTPQALTPGLMRYDNLVAAHSLYNTPPTFSWYLSGLYLQWIKAQGGLSALEKRNKEKARILYELIDRSSFYHNPVHPTARSWMNIPFTLAKKELEAEFLKTAEAAGFIGLKGHSRLGGMRASLYNAMDLEGVKALVKFMEAFESKHHSAKKQQMQIPGL